MTETAPLPELIKNAKDQYSRLWITEPTPRTIVVVVNTREKSIGVIDFAGATADQFKRWETWSDPTANARDKASDIEGGHGNGGKAFMVLGSTMDSWFESCHDCRRTRMGYENGIESKRFKPGIAVEGGKAVEDQRVESLDSLAWPIFVPGRPRALSSASSVSRQLSASTSLVPIASR